MINWFQLVLFSQPPVSQHNVPQFYTSSNELSTLGVTIVLSCRNTLFNDYWLIQIEETGGVIVNLAPLLNGKNAFVDGRYSAFLDTDSLWLGVNDVS